MQIHVHDDLIADSDLVAPREKVDCLGLVVVHVQRWARSVTAIKSLCRSLGCGYRNTHDIDVWVASRGASYDRRHISQHGARAFVPLASEAGTSGTLVR